MTSWEYFASGCGTLGIDYTVFSDWLGGRKLTEILTQRDMLFAYVNKDDELMRRTKIMMEVLDKLFTSLFMSFLEIPSSVTKRVENLLWIAFTCSIDPNGTFTYFSSLSHEVTSSAVRVLYTFGPLYNFIVGEGNGCPADMNPLGLVLQFGSAWEKYVCNMRAYVDWGQSRDLPRYERIITQCFHWSRIMGYSVDPDALVLMKEVKGRYDHSVASYRKRAMGRFNTEEMLQRCKENKDHLSFSGSWDDIFMGQGCFRAVAMRYKKMVHNDQIDIPSGKRFRIGVEIFDILECARMVDDVGDELNLEPPCFHGVGLLMVDVIGRVDGLSELWALSKLGLDAAELKKRINDGGFMLNRYPDMMTKILDRMSYMLVEPLASKFQEFKAVMSDTIRRVERGFVMNMFSSLFESVRYLHWEGKKNCFNEYLVVFPDVDSKYIVSDVAAYFDNLVKNRGLATKNAADFFRRSILHTWNSISAGSLSDRAEHMRKNMLDEQSLSGVFSVFIGGVVRWMCECGKKPSYHRLPEMFMFDYGDMARMVDCLGRVVPAMSMVSVLWTMYHREFVAIPVLYQRVTDICEEYVEKGCSRDIDWFVWEEREAVSEHYTGSASCKHEILKMVSAEGINGGSMGNWTRGRMSYYIVEYVMSDVKLPLENWMQPLQGFHAYLDSLMVMFHRLIRFHFHIHEKRYGEIARAECRSVVHTMTQEPPKKPYKSSGGGMIAVCNGGAGAGGADMES